MKDTIKLTYGQWLMLGFYVKKGSKGTENYSQLFDKSYYTFTQDQVIKKEDLEMYREEMLDREPGCPDF